MDADEFKTFNDLFLWWFSHARNCLVSDNNEETGSLKSLREREQRRLRQIHFEITIDHIERILKKGPWLGNPILVCDHLVWAAKHV